MAAMCRGLRHKDIELLCSAQQHVVANWAEKLITLSFERSLVLYSATYMTPHLELA